MQVMEQDPISPRQLNPNVDRDLETICLKCLEKERNRRYDSARELIDEPGTVSAGRANYGASHQLARSFLRWCRRKPILASVAGALIIAMVTGVTGIAWQWRRAEQNRLEAESNASLATRNEQAAHLGGKSGER